MCERREKFSACGVPGENVIRRVLRLGCGDNDKAAVVSESLKPAGEVRGLIRDHRV